MVRLEGGVGTFHSKQPAAAGPHHVALRDECVERHGVARLRLQAPLLTGARNIRYTRLLLGST
jgi:hypothetical protein